MFFSFPETSFMKLPTLKCRSSDAKAYFVRCLILCFLNITTILFGGLVFQFLEGSYESAYKCGVKRVRRDFIDSLWNETSSLEEIDWKSSARHKLMTFENELHEAVEAGIHSYSGQKSWTLDNSVLYTFSLVSTLGFGSVECSTRLCQIFSCAVIFLGTPLFYLFISELTRLTIVLYNLHVLKTENASLVQPLWRSGYFLAVVAGVLVCLYSFIYGINLMDSIHLVTGILSTNGFTNALPDNTLWVLFTGGLIVLSIVAFTIFQVSMQIEIRSLLNNKMNRLGLKVNYEEFEDFNEKKD